MCQWSSKIMSVKLILFECKGVEKTPTILGENCEVKHIVSFLKEIHFIERLLI